MRSLPFTIVGSALFALVGCGDSGDGAGGSSGDECSADQVQVEYLDGPEDGRTECAAIPAACNGAVTCGDDSQECAAAVYGLCEFDYIGVGCSPLEGHPSLLSCNP